MLLSCKTDKPSRIEYEKSFEEMVQLAADGNKYFGIVLSNPECSPCEMLHQILFDDISLFVGKRAAFNIVDITLPQNRWYQQFIASKGTPATLIFSPNAELKAIIPGAGRVGIECIKNVLNGQLECTRYYNRRFLSESTTQEDLIKNLNLILTAKKKIENKEDATTELEESLNTLYYPYPLWLQIQNEQNKGNAEDAASLARQMLTFQNPMYAVLYSNLFLESRQVIDPDFDPKNMPKLEIENEDIHLGILQLNEKVNFQIKLKNAGKETLAIHDINIGCSCLAQLNDIDREIETGNDILLHLEFTAEHKGEITRNVMIVTNGIEPMRFINIRANVR
jgi:hypothetical protein